MKIAVNAAVQLIYRLLPPRICPAFAKVHKPQQNAYIERYNRTVRYDWLSHYLFESIADVQDYATDWMWTYNHERPNMALGGITPKQKLANVIASTSGVR